VATERHNKVFSENRSIRGLFGFESSFQNCFWNIFSSSGSSQICKIRYAWKKTGKTLFRAWDLSISWERTWKFPGISYFTDMRRTREAKNIPNTVLKTRLETKETTYTSVFRKYLVSLRSHSIRAFSVFLEELLWIILGFDVLGKI
jgi:hypothetical protein